MTWVVTLSKPDENPSQYFVSTDGAREYTAQFNMLHMNPREVVSFDQPPSSFFVASEEIANSLAEFLVNRHPGTTAIVAKASASYSSVVQKMKTTKAVFTEKGFFPV